ncbi:uncharacterized protein DFL_003842 [Arthrobotrys flagrans]|uniref:Glutamine synthetase n=1 Tax=Arthrobotrys flagrans TaxID=97331 RepID=A0A437A322_ARTFL|nr:hypothetical protein DFL_003842 [Arthrobotrys flagrans]
MDSSPVNSSSGSQALDEPTYVPTPTATEIDTGAASFFVASSLSELEHIIDNCPIIDNHAHPLLTEQTLGVYEASGLNLLRCLSEANDDALKDVPNTLVYHRAIKFLKEGFSHFRHGYDEVATWNDWKSFRSTLDPAQFARECFNGLQTILLDTGLRYPAHDEIEAHSVIWHNKFLKSPAKEILRLEYIAEDEIKIQPNFHSWEAKLRDIIRKALKDDNTAGFKSVVCYRGGLNINGDDFTEEFVINAYQNILVSSREDGWKLSNSRLNDFLLHLFAREMTRHVEQGGKPKPLQFHTGLGDSDLRLKDSNPILLQQFIEAYPRLPIVLLHAGYPFTREAGYLASTYANVYLDFGLVFSTVSQEGQESIVKQVLELTPSSKAMWSTDGHHYGETYYLAQKQVREVFKTIMKEIYNKGNVSVESISNIVTDLFFNTSNQLYNLKLDLNIPAPGDYASHAITNTDNEPEHRGRAGLKLLQGFLAKNPGIEYLRLNWLDYSAILRTRVVKIKHVVTQLEKNINGSIVGVTKASLYILVNCMMVEGANACGEDRLVPDFTSIRLHPHQRNGQGRPNHATVMCWMQDPDSHKTIPLCPRGILKNALARASNAGLSNFKVGFEIEFCIFKQSDLDEGRVVPITTHHTWTTSRSLQTKALDILEEIDQKLSEAGIEIEQFHSESAQGQYEIAISPLQPMQAVDGLIYTREVIQWVCAKYGYRASLLPKPFDNECGTASHVHMSFKPIEKQWNFFAGLLENMRALNAVILGGEISFERIVPGAWAGGVWACWGRQNREAPLRLVEEDKAHWEIKAVDGIANMYLAIAGIITAGTAGVVQGIDIYGEADRDASLMTAEERQKRGIKTEMTKSMDEATSALFEKDGKTPNRFSEAMAPGFARHMTVLKKAEKEYVYSQFIDPQTGSPDAPRRRAWAAQWY